MTEIQQGQATADQGTVTEAIVVHPKTPKFEHCMVDESTPILTIEFTDVTFRLRSITAGESADIDAESILADPYEDEIVLADGKVRKIRIRYDGNKKILKTVAAALGAREQIGKEGWTYAAPVTEKAVAHLADGLVQWLWERHSGFFRADRFGTTEPGPSDSVEPGKGDGQLVP